MAWKYLWVNWDQSHAGFAAWSSAESFRCKPLWIRSNHGAAIALVCRQLKKIKEPCCLETFHSPSFSNLVSSVFGGVLSVNMIVFWRLETDEDVFQCLIFWTCWSKRLTRIGVPSFQIIKLYSSAPKASSLYLHKFSNGWQFTIISDNVHFSDEKCRRTR